jgi:hypothetical protein
MLAATAAAAAIQEHVFQCLMHDGGEQLHSRWMLHFPLDWSGEVKPQLSRIEPDSFILPLSRFAEGIEESVLIDDETLFAIGEACARRLRYRAEQRAKSRRETPPRLGRDKLMLATPAVEGGAAP